VFTRRTRHGVRRCRWFAVLGLPRGPER